MTYNTCVTIAGQAGRLDEALELLRKASEEGGLELDVVSYRAALGGLRREKRWEAAVKLLGDMQRRGLGQDEVNIFEILFFFSGGRGRGGGGAFSGKRLSVARRNDVRGQAYTALG